MMICKADFEELFPDLQPSADCIARWEDDGGRSKPATRHVRAASGRRSQYGSDMPAFARAGVMAATMPAMAAYGAAWTMLSTYGRMTTDRRNTL